MHRTSRLALAATLLATSSFAFAQREVEGDTLLVDRVEQARSLDMPARGISMQQVESRWGAPMQRLDPRGGQKPQWPVINRWVYPEFTVYFEHSHVVDVVARKASATEIAPKPVR
ncbi:hypothetical protein [Chiayiivirga flava]|uniref:Lipoprotein SmpA/OmlA domain-containing protein n=1 Tax=Chiayiivirga flava TaxID=659595 RepID=A0A7W8D6H9_9GAMM|nr:hypothetical protein [Chiayiivirga flava]MBB5208437.1 hypothetical protein [Chiayiivirga flava]